VHKGKSMRMREYAQCGLVSLHDITENVREGEGADAPRFTFHVRSFAARFVCRCTGGASAAGHAFHEPASLKRSTPWLPARRETPSFATR
jgi:hypothetical protein